MVALIGDSKLKTCPICLNKRDKRLLIIKLTNCRHFYPSSICSVVLCLPKTYTLAQGSTNSKHFLTVYSFCLRTLMKLNLENFVRIGSTKTHLPWTIFTFEYFSISKNRIKLKLDAHSRCTGNMAQTIYSLKRILKMYFSSFSQQKIINY